MQNCVWVAYATAKQQWHIALPFQLGMTVADAIRLSNIASMTTLPEPLDVGLFGLKCDDLQTPLKAGDRVEIYRPLQINPKDIRRLRAAKHPVGRYIRRLGQGVKQAAPSSSEDE